MKIPGPPETPVVFIVGASFHDTILRSISSHATSARGWNHPLTEQFFPVLREGLQEAWRWTHDMNMSGLKEWICWVPPCKSHALAALVALVALAALAALAAFSSL